MHSSGYAGMRNKCCSWFSLADLSQWGHGVCVAKFRSSPNKLSFPKTVVIYIFFNYTIAILDTLKKLFF